MRTTTVTLLALLVAPLALAGCDRPGAPEPSTRRDPVTLPKQLIGTWEDDQNARIQLRGSGTMSGYDGCNEFRGTWSTASPDGMELRFAPRNEHQCDAAATLQLTPTMTWELRGGKLLLTSTYDKTSTLTKRATGGMG